MQQEKYFTRDRSYSAWHRLHSIGRFIGLERALKLSLIDIDAILFEQGLHVPEVWVEWEYDGVTKWPLALMETAIDINKHKDATAIGNLAKMTGRLEAYVVLYRLGSTRNPFDDSVFDIDRFRVKRLWPEPESKFRILSPEQWAFELLEIRKRAVKRTEWVAAAADR
jgi:hypothetical protein